jgi:hypothetical protein
MDLKDLLDCTVHIIFTGRFGVELFYGERTPRDSICRSVPIEIGELGKPSGMDNDSQGDWPNFVSIHGCRGYN